ncbi:hypothetical protein B0H19DRAFT_483594 [Mycena capillaripes]|nr:hypothetical protein B0H19DRAFT_483594 [Mycena capillaripes]
MDNRSPPSPNLKERSGRFARDYSLVRDALIWNPQLHSILAVALVFHQTPSPLQISHVLDISWENVRQSLVPVRELLDPAAVPEHFYSDIVISDRLRKVLSDPTCAATFVDQPRWHAFVAVWCLTRSNIKYDARDIFYASDFWSQHVCSARPSQDIWDALRRSSLPCRLGSHAMLPWVISWLGTVDSEDTRELIAIYRSSYRQTAAAVAAGARVKVMGGLISMQL